MSAKHTADDSLVTHPLPLVAGLLFSMAGFRSVYVYRFHQDRWHLKADNEEYMLIDLPEGLKLVDNPF